MARGLNFRQIEAFRAVMLTGTTVAAAEMLHTTQPSISRLLAQIQSTTRLKLFELDRGRLRSTPEASVLLEAVERNFIGLEKIEEAVNLMRQSGTGLLRIGCTPTLGMSVLPFVVKTFQEQHPDVRITLRTIGSHFIRDGLLSGLFDVGLTTNPNQFDGEEFQTRIVDEVKAVCVMSRGHDLASKPIIKADHFAGNPLITLDSADDLNDEWRRVLVKRKIAPSSVIETTYSATVCTLASVGAGIGVVNPYIASIFADRIHIANLDPAIPVKVVVAYPRHISLSALSTSLINTLSEYFKYRKASKPRRRASRD
jgi:DNA-binding transcriptional LysR family regulator